LRGRLCFFVIFTEKKKAEKESEGKIGIAEGKLFMAMALFFRQLKHSFSASLG